MGARCTLLVAFLCSHSATLGYVTGPAPARRRAVHQRHRLSTPVSGTTTTSSSSLRPPRSVRCHDGSIGDVLRAEHLDSLSRLAAHLSHAAISSIQDVSIANVAGDSLELHVVSCEDDRCVSLLLPVEFPTMCDVDADDFGACVVANVRRLDDDLAKDTDAKKTREAATTADAAPTSAKFRVLAADTQRPRPVWWTDALDADLARACGDFREVLNSRDFERDVVAMARRAAPAESARVVAANVDRLGPNGILVTALDVNHVSFKIDIPFGRTCADAASLRDAVLGEVSGEPHISTSGDVADSSVATPSPA